MSSNVRRRDFAAFAAGAAGLAAGFVEKLCKSRAEQRALRLIARSDLGVLDPIWTTAYVTRNHGYMIFDTLFALDSKLQPRRQMVADYSVSPDLLSYRLTLRSGLRFHDGSAVRGADCTASLRRWMARDGLGQTLAGAVGEMTADDRSLTIRVREPFPLLLMALAKVGPPAPRRPAARKSCRLLSARIWEVLETHTRLAAFYLFLHRIRRRVERDASPIPIPPSCRPNRTHLPLLAARRPPLLASRRDRTDQSFTALPIYLLDGRNTVAGIGRVQYPYGELRGAVRCR